MAYKVMIVDDEDLVSVVSGNIFNDARIRSTHVEQPDRSAQEAHDCEKFHVVLMDINMPQMTGLELLKRVKTARPTVQVIMMTAYTTIQKCIECMTRRQRLPAQTV